MVSLKFNKLDLFGENPQLTYGHSPRYQTCLGAFFSVLTLVSIFLSFRKSYIFLYDPHSAEVSTSIVFEKESPLINLMENGFYPMVSVQKEKNKKAYSILKIAKIFSFIGKMESVHMNLTNYSNSEENVESISFSYKPCYQSDSKILQEIL